MRKIKTFTMFAKSQRLYIQGELREREAYNRRWRKYVQEFLDENDSKQKIQTFIDESKAMLESAWQEHEDSLRDYQIIFSRQFEGMSDEVYWLLVKDQYIYRIWRWLEEIEEALYSEQENNSDLIPDYLDNSVINSFPEEENISILSSIDASERTDLTSSRQLCGEHFINDLATETCEHLKEKYDRLNQKESVDRNLAPEESIGDSSSYLASTINKRDSVVNELGTELCETLLETNSIITLSYQPPEEAISLSKDLLGYDFKVGLVKFFDLEFDLPFFLCKWIDEACAWLTLLLLQWFFMHFSHLEGFMILV